MSGTETRSIPRNATADDCARLWSTLTLEFIPQLRIQLRPLQGPDGNVYLEVAVVDDSLESLDGSPLENVWASKEFVNPLHLISMGQLFDLLIMAYRQIDGFFENGTPSAPTRRRK